MQICSLCNKEHDTDNFIYCPECKKNIMEISGIDESEYLTEEEQQEQQGRLKLID